MYKNDDTCQICGDGNLVEFNITEIFEYKGKHKKVDGFIIFKCNSCEEEIVPEESIKSSEKIIRDFHREVDGLLTSKEIKKIRESFGFSQENFSELLGLGQKTFARYENCTVTQNRTTDHLLRILNLMPESLGIICTQAPSVETYKFKESTIKITVPADQSLVYKYKIGA